MGEILNTFLLDNPDIPIPMARDEFYAEQICVFRKTGKPTRACEIVDVFIFNSHGQLLVQKRSYSKAHNPGLLDKSIGGHVRYGDSPDYTVMVETVQELQAPSIVVRNTEDFKKTLGLLADYLTTVALIRHALSKVVLLEKVVGGETVVIANKVHAYLGLYDGRIRMVDREAQGALFYALAELDKEMKESPALFTVDIHVLLRDLRPAMGIFLDFIRSASSASSR